MSSAIDSRIGKLRELVREQGAAAAYIRDTPNIEWLTGFPGVFDDERAHAILVTVEGGDAWLKTDSRYSTALEPSAEGSQIHVESEPISFPKWLVGKCKELNVAGNVLIEDSMPLSEHSNLLDELAGSDVQLVPTNDVVLKLRSVKDDDEVSLIREAQSITDAAFAHIVSFVQRGMTEREIQLELDFWMLTHGAEGLAFPTIVASGPNGASPHAQVTDRKVMAGDSIVMDFGAKRKGYASDMTRTVFLGEPAGQMLAAWKALRLANESAEKMIRAGVVASDVNSCSLEALEESGFGGLMGHGLGHGVGLECHELPSLSGRNDQPLVAGNIVTVEPGIYVPGKFGMRLEDMGEVTQSGFDVFTKSTHELVVL